VFLLRTNFETSSIPSTTTNTTNNFHGSLRNFEVFPYNIAEEEEHCQKCNLLVFCSFCPSYNMPARSPGEKRKPRPNIPIQPTNRPSNQPTLFLPSSWFVVSTMDAWPWASGTTCSLQGIDLALLFQPLLTSLCSLATDIRIHSFCHVAFVWFSVFCCLRKLRETPHSASCHQAPTCPAQSHSFFVSEMVRKLFKLDTSLLFGAVGVNFFLP